MDEEFKANQLRRSNGNQDKEIHSPIINQNVLIPNKVQENIKFKEQQCKYQYEENKIIVNEEKKSNSKIYKNKKQHKKLNTNIINEKINEKSFQQPNSQDASNIPKFDVNLNNSKEIMNSQNADNNMENFYYQYYDYDDLLEITLLLNDKLKRRHVKQNIYNLLRKYENCKYIYITLSDEMFNSKELSDPIEIRKENITECQIRGFTICIETKKKICNYILFKSIKCILKLSDKLRIHELILTNFSNRHFETLGELRKYLSKINFLRIEYMKHFDEENNIKEKLNLISLVINLKDKNKTINIEIPISV